MENEFVRYSRAGDVFHYRWAARRCLRMIYPKSLLRCIVIEGSKERKLAGEYVIDVTEYSDSAEGDSEKIAYFQLKHTTIRKDQLFKLSDLKDAIEGFAERYSEHFCRESETDNSPIVTFSIVTNRSISDSFKRHVFEIAKGGKALRKDGKENKRVQGTIEKYTKLKGRHLQTFCALLKFADGEGDYNAQRHELHAEISQLLAGTVDNPQIDSITALVQEKALPNSDGRIVREDILKRFGVTSERDLFPAPPEFEQLDNAIPRKQYETLLGHILNASTPIIIHAAGGVGKSIFARQIVDSLPIGSLGVVYDCFGGGRYRNRSEPRHRHRDALVQLANELAAHGLCDPLIAQSTALEDEILRKFLARLRMAITSLRNANENAILAILIDAADNAEMAAKEFSETCFVHELLRESIPDGCQLIALCRTERIHLLQPSSAVDQLELGSFSEEETLVHLERQFPQATDADGLEFHRLTNNGNPRVQANALSLGFGTIEETLNSLGPLGTTVEEQIEAQLDSAISDIKEELSGDYQSHIDAICLGLAILPPFIPLSVLATAAKVDEASVKSFVADLGRSLWLSDTSVQFRDEPTETWFRKKFSATAEQVGSYVTRLEPLAYKYSYVAEALPSLLLQAEKYNELINLALSDDFLPQDNPIDERNVRVYRLQFAFKAALKLERYADATKLALRAGEEMAGDKRQLELLTGNVDLIAPLQSEQRVQELAFRRMLHSGWDGSENVYSAALLSSVEDFKGEARGYLRAANNWLRLYFEEREKSEKVSYQDRLEDIDIVELTFAYFNLFGISEAVNSILSWRPPEVVYRIAQKFIRRLIDAGNFDAIDEISTIDSRNQYLMIALAYELLAVGRFPRANSMERCLDLLTTSRARIPKPRYSHGDTTLFALLSFIEACAARNLPKVKILRVLRHYVPVRAPRYISSDIQYEARNTYLRAVALRCVLSGNLEPNLDELLPDEFIKKEQTYRHGQDAREFNEIVGGLLPWYIIRARILVNDIDDLLEVIKDVEQQSKSARTQRWKDHDIIPYEISQICIEILILCQSVGVIQVEKFFADHLKENQYIWIQDHLKAVRAAFRLDHLSGIRRQLEQFAYGVAASTSIEGPETRAEWYIDLARAVLPMSRDDAAAYFDYAIEAVSKFGDEIVQRWEAIAALANRSAEGGHVSPEMAYRFIRCAELIGDNVAREKYWDRNQAVRICTRLSPVSALAALSRWCDRDVGWFDEQLVALADEIVHSNFLSPSVGWSLSAFFEGYGLGDFASLCIERESSTVHRQYILDAAIRDLGLGEVTEKSWQKLEQIAQQHSIENRELDDILTFYAANPERESEESTQRISHSSYQDKSEPVEWEKILSDLELTTSSGISQAIKRFNATLTTFRNYEVFWQEVFNRIDESDAIRFLRALVNAESVGVYNLQHALSSLPGDWQHKVSVKRNWAKIFGSVARRFASKFTNRYILEDFFKPFSESIWAEIDAMPLIRKGILEGLSSNSDLADASTFFGFVEVASPFISPQQATDLLDFALTRFELHIDGDYADGCWSSWLVPPDDISMVFAGFVWAALGSPRSETRWQAAHCVRRLAESNCEREIDALLEWMERDKVGVFGSHKFPFYNLHARLYLLIALARVSINIPQILKRHHRVFSLHALESISHALIQRFSADIALNIEQAFPNTYSRDIVEQLYQVGVSQLPVKEMDSYGDKLESYWHMKGEVDTSLKFYHGYDFARYWFEPLGNVYGISGKQVDELATEVIVNEWSVNTDGSYQSDPRAGLWRSGRNERETWHDHGTYPRTDNYSFYLSYHAMFVVAARLLEKIPVVHRRDWCEDEWAEWLHRHLLTRNDGQWLADRRDPAPLLRRDWIHQEQTKNWRSEITTVDFLDGVLFKRKGETWLNVFGSWEEGDRERAESFRISTALVSPVASQSLLNALTTCPNPYDFKLPDYQEEDMEFGSYPFVLKGWVWRGYTDNRLDEYDLYAGQIAFPPYQVGESIVEKLGLSVDSEQREWFLPNTDKASMLCELWSTSKPRPDEDPLRHGERLSASLAFLKNLCLILECELVFEVQINRQFKRKSYMRNEDEIGYTPPHNKVYILSADGKLRDTETHYQLG
ncbi:MAG: ATP-binding protein [Planctomycetes bacterium]|nr:ATP-binding protein [Planctomycetota bacterium]